MASKSFVYGQLLFFGFLFSLPAFGTPRTENTRTKWRLVWSDEFDKPGRPDPAKWEHETGGGGWGNNELEHYTDRLQNSRVRDGRLVIEARKEEFSSEHYTSARLHVKNAAWKYGKIVVRAKLPKGAGTWPAIWMMPKEQSYGTSLWPDNGEIDIMEHVGREPNQILSCFYTKNFNWTIGTGKTVFVEVDHLESRWHTYALEWDENVGKISIDGVTYNAFENPHTTWEDWPFDHPFYLILNLALGGFGGDVTDDSIFPQKFLIDYVRVYQKHE